MEGDPEQAALMAGRPRACAGGAWPSLRRGEAEVVAQVRGALEADRFGKVFAVGARLNLREAEAAVRHRRGTGTTAP